MFQLLFPTPLTFLHHGKRYEKVWVKNTLLTFSQTLAALCFGKMFNWDKEVAKIQCTNRVEITLMMTTVQFDYAWCFWRPVTNIRRFCSCFRYFRSYTVNIEPHTAKTKCLYSGLNTNLCSSCFTLQNCTRTALWKYFPRRTHVRDNKRKKRERRETHRHCSRLLASPRHFNF